jgi:hypothetical protein
MLMILSGMPPYLREEDIPEPACEGSFVELNWQGTWDDPTRPKEIVCRICGAKLTPEYEQYESDGKKGIFFIAMPIHYPGTAP